MKELLKNDHIKNLMSQNNLEKIRQCTLENIAISHYNALENILIIKIWSHK